MTGFKRYFIPKEKRIYDTLTTSSASQWIKGALQEKAQKLGIPPSRLMSNILFNAFENNYDDALWQIELPDISKIPYVEKKYIGKAGTMLRTIEKFTTGATLEDLALLYKEMGFKDLEEMLLAHRELVKVEMIVEERKKDPFTGKLKKVYMPDYLTKKMVDKKNRKMKPLEKTEPEKGPLDD